MQNQIFQSNAKQTNLSLNINGELENKSGVALTKFSLTLHFSRSIFYYQYYIHI